MDRLARGWTKSTFFWVAKSVSKIKDLNYMYTNATSKYPIASKHYNLSQARVS
jgi:hypothetical protein